MQQSYIHGFSPFEQQRLTRLQQILNEIELDAMRLNGIESFLDVGSGLGQFTRAVARRLGTHTTVIGVENDHRQRREADRQAVEAGEPDLVEFREGSAQQLPLTDAERGTFDMAHARFLLEHVPDPEIVVREMVHAVRPGGRLVLVDDDHELLRLWPDCPIFSHVWREYWESYRDIGCDPLIGRRLAQLLHSAGATPIRATTLFFGAVRGDTRFDLVLDNTLAILQGAAESLIGSGRITRSDKAHLESTLQEWRTNPSASFWYSIPLVEARLCP